jgi:hypothetical protein
MKGLAWANLIGLAAGIIFIVLAQRKRTPEQPPWYKAAIFAPFGWKRRWWTPAGFRLQVIGAIALYIGLLSGVVYYWYPWS